MAKDTDFEQLMKALVKSQERQGKDSFEKDRQRVLNEIDQAMSRSATAAELSSQVAKDMKKTLTDRLPSVSDIVGSVIDANPLLSTARNVANLFSPGDVGKGAADERNQHLKEMRDEIANMAAQASDPPPAPEVVFEPSPSISPEVGDELLKSNNRQLDVLMDLYEVWAGATHILKDSLAYDRRLAEMAEEADRESDRDDLRGEREEKQIPSPVSGGTAVREDGPSAIEQSLDDIIGSVIGNTFGSMLSKIAPMAAGLGKMLKGSVRLLGPLAMVATLLWDFYKGFSDPQAVLGRASEGLGDNIQAGVVNIFKSIGGLVDWVTGLVNIDLDLENLAKDIALDYTNKLRGLFTSIPEMASSIYTGIVNSFERMKADAMKSADEAFEAIGGAKDYMGALITGLVDGVANWLVDLLSSMKDLPVVGGYVQEAIDKINTMRETQTAELEGSGSSKQDTAKTVIKGSAEEAKVERERKANRDRVELAARENQTVVNSSQQTNVNTTHYNAMGVNTHNDEPTRLRNELATQRTY